jgi:hypothetical protein
MALRQYDIAVGQDKIGVSETGTVTAISGGASTLGGTTGIRMIVDDAVTLTKHEALRMIEILEIRVTEENWPPA